MKQLTDDERRWIVSALHCKAGKLRQAINRLAAYASLSNVQKLVDSYKSAEECDRLAAEIAHGTLYLDTSTRKPS